MDRASSFGLECCGFESCRGHKGIDVRKITFSEVMDIAEKYNGEAMPIEESSIVRSYFVQQSESGKSNDFLNGTQSSGYFSKPR